MGEFGPVSHTFVSPLLQTDFINKLSVISLTTHCLWCSKFHYKKPWCLFIYLVGDMLNLLNLKNYDLSILENSKPLSIQMLPLPHFHHYFLLEIWLNVLGFVTLSSMSLAHFSIVLSLCATFCISSAIQSHSSLNSFTMSNLFDYLCYVLFNFTSFIFHFEKFYVVLFQVWMIIFNSLYYLLMYQFIPIFLSI